MRIDQQEFPNWWEEERVALSNLRFAARTLATAGDLERLGAQGGGPLDRALADFLRAHPAMGKNDRKILTLALYGFVRHRELIRAVLPNATPGEGEWLTLALLDRLTEESRSGFPAFPEVQPDLLRLDSLREAARRALENHQNDPLTVDSTASLSRLFSIPAYWLELGPWKTVGEAYLELATARKSQEVHLRVNIARNTREAVLQEFQGVGVEARATQVSPWGVILSNRLDLRTSRLWKEGLIEVQDEGSQLVAALCGPFAENLRILDYCAGAGGKSLSLAAATANILGHVEAFDADSSRLRHLTPRIQRSGITNVTMVDRKNLGQYDLVLVDAPCSSSGTIRRNPEIPWRWTREQILNYSRIQLEVLGAAARHVKPGGRLVYVTCSLLNPENLGSLEAFLEKNDHFSLENFPEKTLPGFGENRIRLALNRESYAGDVFFVARMRRQA